MPASTNGQSGRRDRRGDALDRRRIDGVAIDIDRLGIARGERRREALASANASPGGRIERMKSAAAISSSLAADHAGRLGPRRRSPRCGPCSEVSTLSAVIDKPFSDGRAHHAGRDHCNDRSHDVLDSQPRHTLRSLRSRSDPARRSLPRLQTVSPGVRTPGALCSRRRSAGSAAVGARLIDHAVARHDLGEDPRVGRLLHLEGIEAGAHQEMELVAQHVAGGAQRAAKAVASRATAAPGCRRGRRGISGNTSATSARWPSHGSSSATRRSFGHNTPSEPSRRISVVGVGEKRASPAR